MFYGAFVLAKKGPLAKVWLAAHWDKKLTKAHVFETDVEATVDSIISPQVKMALRTSGHLLLGVVRIYSRKQKYLIHDLGEACAKIKMAFRPGIVDLPSDNGPENADAITLPEIFHDFEASVANLETLNLEGQYTVNPSRASEITIAEDPTTTSGSGNIFGDFGGFEDFDGNFGSAIDETELEKLREMSSSKLEENKTKSIAQITDSRVNQTGDGDEPSKELSDLGGIISDARADFGGDDGMLDLFAGGDMMGDAQGEETLQQEPSLPEVALEEASTTANASDNKVEEMEVDITPAETHGDSTLVEEPAAPSLTAPPTTTTSAAATAAAPPEEESFVLEHVEPRGTDAERRTKRKRRLVVDTDKEFTGQQIKSQFEDYKDLMQQKFFPPPTKKAMRWKEIAGCDQLFSSPTTPCLCGPLGKVVSRNYHVDIPGEPAETVNLSELNSTAEAPTLDETSFPAPDPTLEGEPQREQEESRGPGEEVPQQDLLDFGGADGGADMMFEQENYPEGGGEGGGGGGGEVSEPPPAEEEPNSREMMPDIVDFDDGIPPTQSTDQQQSEELTEEFEQRRWTKRTQNIMGALQHSLEKSPKVELSILTARCNRKQAASRFYTCLLLAKEGVILVDQEVPYGPIKIQKGLKLIELEP